MWIHQDGSEMCFDSPIQYIHYSWKDLTSKDIDLIPEYDAVVFCVSKYFTPYKYWNIAEELQSYLIKVLNYSSIIKEIKKLNRGEMMGFRRAFRRATRSIGRIGRSVSGSLSGVLGTKKSSDGGGDNSYQGIDPSQYQALQDQFSQLQQRYSAVENSNRSMTDQYNTLNKQFGELMNQYKSMMERNGGLENTIKERDNALKQEQLNRDSEKSKYDALNMAIGERGKFDQPQDETDSQGAGENSYGINQQNINFSGKVNPNGDVKDDDDVKRRLSRILQERGQMR